MLKKHFIDIKIFLEETLKNGVKNKINLDENFIEFKEVYKIYLQPSLFKKELVLIPLIESLHWANENYKKSFSFRDEKMKPFFEQKENLLVSYENIYSDFLLNVEQSINLFLFNNKLDFEYKNNLYLIKKDSINPKDLTNLKEDLNALLSILFHNFLIKLVEKDFVFFSANYVFISQKDTNLKPSSVNISINLIESKIKIVNAGKVIEVNLLKRAVNRLSLISQKLNDGFRMLSSGKAIYKIMFAGRRNAFEEFDRVIVESILQGKE